MGQRFDPGCWTCSRSLRVPEEPARRAVFPSADLARCPRDDVGDLIRWLAVVVDALGAVSYTHLRAHETGAYL
eukprot:6599725-Pyramimonas_sp.AAC.1